MTGWWSQRYAAEGAASAEGIAKQLGQPTADPLTILVREAAQNSWDAREGDEGPVDFTLDLRRLGENAVTWREVLLPGPEADSMLRLSDGLRHDSYVLVVSDRGTRGLGGPLRADERPTEGVVADFVQFLRNVGEASDRPHGGGTYGFGKGILYGCSSVRTILVDTHCRHDEGRPRRLMAAALGPSFHNSSDIRFTGRHWWGTVEDDVPFPVSHGEADAISARLGLPGYSSDRFGTDIALLGFDLGETEERGERRTRTPHETARFLVSAILWNLWPKMGSAERPAAMRFRVTVDGVEVPIQEPQEVPELFPFVKALDGIRNGDGKGYTRTRDPRDAGRTNLVLATADPRKGAPAPTEVASAMPFEGPLHHIARMREPELIVDYFAGPPHPDPLFAYAGVFRASTEADPLFASSEPPTHDDWVSAGLQGSASGVVSRLRGELIKAVDEKFPRQGGGLQVSVEGLGRLSSRLAGLIPSLTGSGVGAGIPEERPTPGGPGRSGSRRGGSRRRASLSGQPRVTLLDDGPVVEAAVWVPEGDTGLAVFATVDVSLGSGLESVAEAPLGAARPEILGWLSPLGRWQGGANVMVAPDECGTWTVRARYLPDAALRMSVGTGVSDD